VRPRLYGRGPPPEPLGVLLLPVKLEEFELAAHARDLLDIPRVVALEPPRFRRKRVFLGDDVPAVRQARRLRFPGRPRLVVLYDPQQYYLARALSTHYQADVWYIRSSPDPPPAPLPSLAEGTGPHRDQSTQTPSAEAQEAPRRAPSEDTDLILLDQLACEVASGIIVPGGPEDARADNTPLRARLIELDVINTRPFVPGGRSR
jgi:hypothetical protein